MFVLLAAVALAAEPADDDGAWRIAAGSLPEIADPTDLEALLARYGVDARRASLVSASSYAPSAATKRLRVRKVDLADGRVTEPVALHAARGCASAAGTLTDRDARAGGWGGEVAVHPDAGAADDPSIVVVRDNPNIGSLVLVRPGDTVEVREVRRNGRVIDKRVVVRREAERLELRSADDRAWICSSQEESVARRGAAGAGD